jgi:hypothetical protein
VIEAVLHEEVEEVLGARRGTAARTTDGHAGGDLHGDGDRNLGRREPQHHADPEGQLARGWRPAREPVAAWVARPEGGAFRAKRRPRPTPSGRRSGPQLRLPNYLPGNCPARDDRAQVSTSSSPSVFLV